MVLSAQRIARGLSANALALTIDEEFDLVGTTEVAPHINIVTWHPVPMGEKVKHRLRGPLALIHVIAILGETSEVDNTEIAGDRKSTRLNSSHL